MFYKWFVAFSPFLVDEFTWTPRIPGPPPSTKVTFTWWFRNSCANRSYYRPKEQTNTVWRSPGPRTIGLVLNNDASKIPSYMYPPRGRWWQDSVEQSSRRIVIRFSGIATELMVAHPIDRSPPNFPKEHNQAAGLWRMGSLHASFHIGWREVSLSFNPFPHFLASHCWSTPTHAASLRFVCRLMYAFPRGRYLSK